jgi:lipopolysaccharide transport system ATP-binding protein
VSAVIRVEDLWKQYRLGVLGHRALYRDVQSWWARFRGKEDPNLPVAQGLKGGGRSEGHIWALRSVSLEVQQGEVLGIIGRNGAGKSTLLKVISRVTAPTRGQVRIRGRVASLLEVGTGFHPELTGRENIFLNGAILGMTTREIRTKFTEIVAFSGVETFIDTPVKRYSSGMHVRLAFAVAAHLEPEILVVDEVLAVGDLAFQEKCMGKMNEVAKEGRTVLFVSHNLSAISALCPKSFLLDEGQVVAQGPSGVVVPEYLKKSRIGPGTSQLEHRRAHPSSTALVYATKIELEDFAGEKLEYAESGQDVRFIVSYDSAKQTKLSEISIQLRISEGALNHLISLDSEVSQGIFRGLPPQGRFVCSIRKLPLIPGHYDVHLFIFAERQLSDKILFAGVLQVVNGDFFGTKRLPQNHTSKFLAVYEWVWEESTRSALS